MVDNLGDPSDILPDGKLSQAARSDLYGPRGPDAAAILARLERQDSASVSELARPLAIKLPAVTTYLDVLDDAGRISRLKTGAPALRALLVG